MRTDGNVVPRKLVKCKELADCVVYVYRAGLGIGWNGLVRRQHSLGKKNKKEREKDVLVLIKEYVVHRYAEACSEVKT